MLCICCIYIAVHLILVWRVDFTLCSLDAIWKHPFAVRSLLSNCSTQHIIKWTNIIPKRSRGLYSCQISMHKNLWTEFWLDRIFSLSKARKLDKYSDKFWFYLAGKSNLLLEKSNLLVTSIFQFCLITFRFNRLTLSICRHFTPCILAIRLGLSICMPQRANVAQSLSFTVFYK